MPFPKDIQSKKFSDYGTSTSASTSTVMVHVRVRSSMVISSSSITDWYVVLLLRSSSSTKLVLRTSYLYDHLQSRQSQYQYHQYDSTQQLLSHCAHCIPPFSSVTCTIQQLILVP